MSPEAEGQLRLPWTGEFSPGQLGDQALIDALDAVAANEGKRDDIVEAIRSRWFAEAAAQRTDPAERLKQQRTRSSNVLNGMQNYGLVDADCQLTALGQELLEEEDIDARNGAFVGYLLRNRRGLELLEVVRDLQQRGVVITNEALRDELRRRGYTVTTNSGDAGKLRQWLGTAGVVASDWTIDEQRVATLTGISLSIIREWETLTRVQRAFLGTIRRLSDTRGTGPMASPELLDFVREEHGRIFDEGQVKKVYKALSDAGWIDHSVQSSGRGGKGGLIAATEKLINVDFTLLLGFAPGTLPADLRAAMTTPLETIYQDLGSSETYVKGIALELLAVNLASDLGLSPLNLRVRGVRTGGAEVDLVAEAAHLHFSRWLFQCKNTGSVDVAVLAKEIGMATLLHAQVVVIATTGKFSKTVATYAQRVNDTTALQVFLVDGAMLTLYRQGGAMALRDAFHRNSITAMQAKRPQVLEALQDLADDGG